MTPADDKPEFDTPADDAWLERLHGSPAYLKVVDEIDLSEAGPTVSSEAVLAWVRSWGTADELPTPKPE